LQPDISPNSSTIKYTYVVRDAAVEWIQLEYNGDKILRYHLSVKDVKENQ
jgi:hypothetical protein